MNAPSSQLDRGQKAPCNKLGQMMGQSKKGQRMGRLKQIMKDRLDASERRSCKTG